MALPMGIHIKRFLWRDKKKISQYYYQIHCTSKLLQFFKKKQNKSVSEVLNSALMVNKSSERQPVLSFMVDSAALNSCCKCDISAYLCDWSMFIGSL